MNDVLIIGAGISGCYAAYYLSQYDIDVCIIDSDAPGSHASSTNPGRINPLQGPEIPGMMSKFAMQSYRLHLDTWDYLGSESKLFYPKITQCLLLAKTDTEFEQLKKRKRLYEEADRFKAEILDPHRLYEFNTNLKDGFIGAMFTYGSGAVDSRTYSKTILSSAILNGVCHKQDHAIKIKVKNQTYVVTGESGTYSARHLIFATGPWTPWVQQFDGLDFPIKPWKGDLLRITSTAQFDYDISWGLKAFYQVGDGSYMLGGTQEDDHFNEEPNPDAKSDILNGLKEILNDNISYKVKEHISGLRPKTTDGRPIIGPTRNYENMWFVTGGGSKGMLYSAGMGKAISELIYTGKTDLDISSCSPQRFLS